MELHTVFKNKKLWLLNKPPKTHHDKIVPEIYENKWFPAHRLDFETSGLILYAHQDSLEGARNLFNQNSGLTKYYWAGSDSLIEESYINKEIQGFVASRYRSSKKTRFFWSLDQTKNYRSVQPIKHLLTHASVPRALDFNSKYEFKIQLITGARHQIRTFFKEMEAPLKGDPLYNIQESGQFLHLHSCRIEFSKELQKIWEVPEYLEANERHIVVPTKIDPLYSGKDFLTKLN